MTHTPPQTNWLPDFVYTDQKWQSDLSIGCDASGRISTLGRSDQVDVVRLQHRAMLPGLVNAHSHAFQRVLRGLTEYGTRASTDSFWTWREMMYRAAESLTPDDIYDASRMAFLEMALSGITTVGEFHYLHHNPDGTPYEDPNLLAKTVIRAARDVGINIVLLRVAYARAGFNVEPNPRQRRFLESDPEVFLRNFETLTAEVQTDAGSVRTGVAPHSVRAVPLSYLKTISDFASRHELPVHMHVAEQPAEISACIAEHRRSPVALLETEGLLNSRFTAVHAIHVSEEEAGLFARARAMVCACPTTERNLGDGIIPAEMYFRKRVPVALGTDSQIQIDLLEDARELEYGMRLQKMERVILVMDDKERRSALATALFECATRNGSQSLVMSGGAISTANSADFFTVDLNDVSIAGVEPDDLLSTIVFSLSRTAVKDVVVNGRQIVTEGRHADQEEIVQRFAQLQKKLWSDM